jgi:putative ATPase
LRGESLFAPDPVTRSLFDAAEVGEAPNAKTGDPLASRMRPRSLEEFVGQEHILGEGRILRRAIEHDQIGSMIFWGPPGTGKTTLATVIAGFTKSSFVAMSAVSAGVADLRKAVEGARKLSALNGQRTILFVDEIHRFNKAQQDAILPHVEDGTVTLIGATTENPSFEVNSALLSRTRVFTLKPLGPDSLERIIEAALTDTERGLGGWVIELQDDARKHLIQVAGGDARIALNALEMAAVSAESSNGARVVDKPLIEEALQRPSLIYDKAGDMHYHVISAFIKSIRGSDPDAAIYWLARMLEAGEDPLFVARRLVILAAEDIGLAEPRALSLAIAAQQAVHFVGMPEGFLPLAEATLFLAGAPKSNSALTAYGRAVEDVRQTLNQAVPLHLRNATTALNRQEGYGQGYKYSHEFENHYVEQQYLPDELKGRRYYTPTHEGAEREMAERLARWRGEDNADADGSKA